MRLLLAAAAVAFAMPAAAGELSAGPAYVFDRQSREAGAAAVIHWRTADKPVSPYVSLLIHPGHTSIASAGLGWRIGAGSVYLEPSLGAAIHNGPATSYGSRAMFNLNVTAGLKLSSRASLEVAIDHWSNANTARPNHGINAVSMRLVGRF